MRREGRPRTWPDSQMSQRDNMKRERHVQVSFSGDTIYVPSGIWNHQMSSWNDQRQFLEPRVSDGPHMNALPGPPGMVQQCEEQWRKEREFLNSRRAREEYFSTSRTISDVFTKTNNGFWQHQLIPLLFSHQHFFQIEQARCQLDYCWSGFYSSALCFLLRQSTPFVTKLKVLMAFSGVKNTELVFLQSEQ